MISCAGRLVFGVLCLTLLLIGGLLSTDNGSFSSLWRRLVGSDNEATPDVLPTTAKNLQSEIHRALFRRCLFDAGFIGISDPDLESMVLNSLVTYFTPSLTRTLQSTLSGDFDPLLMDDPTTQRLGEFKAGNCTASAELDSDRVTLFGLSTVVLENIEMVPDSDEINIEFFKAANWNATWVLNASFPEITAAANATLFLDLCTPSPLNQPIQAKATISQPRLSLHIAVQGQTNNLILFQSTSQVNAAELLDLRFYYESVRAEVGSFGNWSEVNVGMSLGQMLMHDTTVFELLLRDALQDAMDEALPFKPSNW